MMKTVDCNILRGPEELENDSGISLGAYLLGNIQRHGTKIAQIDGVTGEKLTYSELLVKSRRVLEALRMRGMKQGDVISICSENNLEFCIVAIGALFLGVTCAPLNPAYTHRELLHSLNMSKPSIMFCSSQTVSRVAEVSGVVSFLREIVVFGSNNAHEHTPFSAFLQSARGNVASLGITGNKRVAAIFCSSGTTGLPKGVMITERNVLSAIRHMRDPRFAALTGEETSLAILPLTHAYGLIVNLASISLGMKCVVLPRFEEELFLRSIQNYKVTLMFLVPTLLVFLGKHPLVTHYDLSSVKSIWSSSAPLSVEVQTAVKKRINVPHIRQGYGLTETTLGVLLTPKDKNKYGSSGKLAPGTECKVVDLNSWKTLGPNLSGELCFRGPLIMKGYIGNQQATSACIDADGFLHTGDIGYYDQDEFFFIVGRLKELIKYKGTQVPPAEVEAVLLTHPSIKDAAVMGIPDELAGELPMAFVVLQPDKQITAEEVMAFVAKHVSPQKRLRGGVRFIEAIPKNPSGKILRRELQKVLQSKL